MKVSFEKYLDRIFKEKDRALDQRFIDSEKAVNVALREYEKQLQQTAETALTWKAESNEWRGAMNDKDDRFALKKDSERNAEDIKKLQLSEATLAGKASQNSVIFLAVLAIVSLIVSVFALFLR